MKKNKPRLLVILGPTAIGKSRAALEIAKRVNGEIISADSLQVYRYLNIGTAKPTVGHQLEIPHHLIDILDPDQEFNAGIFRKHARSVISKLKNTQTRIIVVGGTYLYVRALLHGLIQGVASNKGIRDRLRALKSSLGLGYVYEKLKSLDPDSASRIHVNDYVRIERALESYFISGQRISYLQSNHQFKNDEFDYIKIGFYDERDTIKRRIDDRADRMIETGFIEEVKRIRKMGFVPRLKPLQSIGYKQINQYLDEEISLSRAIELIKRDTKRLAKRQMTWLRRDSEIKWYKAGTDINLIAREIDQYPS